MNHISKTLLTALFSAVVLSGCATGDTRIASATSDSVQQALIKGKTTKPEVIAAYGEPSGRGLSDGMEVWEYQTAKVGAAGFIPFVGLATGKNHIGGKSLQVYFNKKGTVERTEMRESNL